MNRNTKGIGLNIFLLAVMILTISCKNEKTIHVAAIQLNVKVGEFDANLKNAEKYIREAFEGGADLVLVPEFFTTPGFGFPYHMEVVEDIEPFDGPSLTMLRSLSAEYNGIIGGSFLAYHGEDIYNSFVLVFPDGKYFVHNKDYPTYDENCFYTGGEDDGIFETEIGTIGVAMCWEYLRTETARRMLDKVDLVIGGSCWPAFQDPVQGLQGSSARNLVELQNAPTDFATLLGVPVVHTNHVGKVSERYMWQDKEMNETMYYLGEAKIVDGHGQVIQNLSYEDGEGIIWGDISMGKVKESTPPIPDRFWIPEFSEDQHNSWKASLTGPYLDFYEEVALPYTIKKHKIDSNKGE